MNRTRTVQSSHAAVTARSRAAGIEVLRIIAAFGIVWFHAGAPGAEIGYGGLVAFMMLSTALAVSGGSSSSIRDILRARSRRLIIPWLAWSAIYGVLAVVYSAALQRPISDAFAPWMVLTGTVLPLWYLPVAFVVTSCVTILCSRGLIRTHGDAWLPWALAGAIGIVVSSLLLPEIGNLIPIAQWVFVAPSVFLGIGFASIPRDGRAGRKSMTIVLLCAGAATSSAIKGFPMLWVPYVSGVVAFALCRVWHREASPRLLWWSNLSFGIFLVHVLALGITSKLLPTLTALSATAAFAASSALAACMRRTPLRVIV